MDEHVERQQFFLPQRENLGLFRFDRQHEILDYIRGFERRYLSDWADRMEKILKDPKPEPDAKLSGVDEIVKQYYTTDQELWASLCAD